MKTRVRPLPDAGRHAERGRGGLEHRQGRHHRLGQARVQDRGRRRRIMDRLRNSSCDSLGMEAWSRSAPSCALASHNSRLAVTHAPSLCLQSRAREGTRGWRSVRYETSVDVVSRHVLIAVLRKDAHHIPAARRPGSDSRGWCWAGVPEQYQSISPTAPAPVSLRRPTHRHIPAQRAQLPRFHTERHNQDTTRSMMGEKHRSRRRARLAMAALPEAAHGSTSTRPHRRQALPTALPSAPAQARPAPAAPPSERRPKATVTASSSDSRGGAGRGCQSSTRGVAVVTACFGRLCCGARSSFAPSASTGVQHPPLRHEDEHHLQVHHLLVGTRPPPRRREPSPSRAASRDQPARQLGKGVVPLKSRTWPRAAAAPPMPLLHS